MSLPEAPTVTVLYGGVGAEREVSLRSGGAVAGALSGNFAVDRVELTEASVPSIDPAATVVFPALHGEFGEDGGLQALLEARGIEYAGSDAAASRCCFDKAAAKEAACRGGVRVAGSMVVDPADGPDPGAIVRALGEDLVVKPAASGSSVGLAFARGAAALAGVFERAGAGRWLVEQRIRGRETTVGVLEGRALGVVEVISADGVYDYEAKYRSGRTGYRYPAELDPAVAGSLRAAAEQAFAACGCRDFARVDFILAPDGPFFLEVNTLPGLTATSLLPKSAACEGYDFPALAAALVAPAVRRFRQRHGDREA